MTNKEKILDVLSDGKWHTRNELINFYYKFDTRISELRKDGYIIDAKQNPDNTKKELMYLLNMEISDLGGINEL